MTTKNTGYLVNLPTGHGDDYFFPFRHAIIIAKSGGIK